MPTSSPRRLFATGALVALLAAACPAGERDDPPADGGVDADDDVPRDGGGGDGSSDGGGDADGADADGSGSPALWGPGPASFVVSEALPVVDRMCDLDGDGTLDNAFADLGASAELVIMTITGAFGGSEGETRPFLLHFPFVEDRQSPTDPEVVAITFRGFDIDRDPSDNMSGAEPFEAEASSLDDCGEPLYALEEASIDRGVVTASGGDTFVFLSETVPIRRARLEATIAWGCAGAELLMCGAAVFRDLAAVEAPDPLGHLTMLEIFLSGGAPFGLSTVPGLAPDVDMDGDGLERVLVDDTFVVASCVDGDLTVIEGRECAMDPRMADAFSVTVHAEATSAFFFGREPSWEARAAERCDELPAESLFEPR